MRAPLVRVGCLLSLLIASSASAVSMAWTPIGIPGNACDSQPQGCFGTVGYAYSIGTYDVTNAQYAEFLNAKAASDPLGLYNTNMANSGLMGGITRTGVSGIYSYSAIASRGDMPVNFVSFYDALRFANWMNNGQGSGDTETGSYTLFGGTATPSNGTVVPRNDGATIVLTSENEWYKAAYYNPLGASYFDYPMGSDALPNCSAPTATANSANCLNAAGDFTNRGSYTGSASPLGTFDQGGNAWEWNEAIIPDGYRLMRGGATGYAEINLKASERTFYEYPSDGRETFGFRLAMIPGGYVGGVVPEPSTGVLVIAGLLGLAGWRRRA